MIIDTVKFGKIEIEKRNIITFSEGIIGFNNIKKYVLVDIEEIVPFKWFQAVDDSALCFLIVDPLTFKQDYKVPITKEDLSSLKSKDLNNLKTVVITTVFKNPKLITANLKAPVIINPELSLAKQIVLTSEEYSTRQPIVVE